MHHKISLRKRKFNKSILKNKDNSAKEFLAWINTSTDEAAVDYQRSAQITWWSILQGIAVGAFVSKVPNVLNLIFQNGQWYLLVYTITTFLIIVLVWVQMAWAILIARWQISLSHTSLILLFGISVSLLCFQIDNPLYWFIATIFFVLCGIGVYVYNFCNKTFLGLDHKRNLRIAGGYVFFLFLSVIAVLRIYFYGRAATFSFWGIMVLICTMVSLAIQQRQMHYERKTRKIP